MRFLGFVGAAPALITLLAVAPAFGAIAGLQIAGTNGTLSQPTFVAHAPGDRNRIFVAQLDGTIKIIDIHTNLVTVTPFLTIPAADIDVFGEGGLLGLAFHPDYLSTDINNPGRGKFYVYVTVDNDLPEEISPFSSHVREYTVIGDPATSSSANPTYTREILKFTQPQYNHNGGWIGFNPKLAANQPQYLYIASGDGGAGDDFGPGHTEEPGVPGNAQDISDNLLGKMLRIDISADAFPNDPNRNYAIPPTNPFVGIEGDDEILAYGLRNPFRASFDRKNGDLWIGDVGQGNREEIDLLPATRTEVANFGWRLREGDIATPGVGGTEPEHYVPPLYSYTHPDTAVPLASPPGFDGVLVTGGYVYRGPDPSLQGEYFFFDSRSSPTAADDNYWRVTANPFGTVTNFNSLLPLDASTAFPVSFGEDDVGNIYIAYLVSGQVQRLVTNELLPGDFDADGSVDFEDYAMWCARFDSAAVNPAADGNGNATYDAADYVAWRKASGTPDEFAIWPANFGHTNDSTSNFIINPATPEPTIATLLILAAVICSLLRWRAA